MKKDVIEKLTKNFEDAAHIHESVEYWMARDLQVLFEYSSWDNFLNVVEKAKTACTNSKSIIINHFHEVVKMVSLGSDAARDLSFGFISLSIRDLSAILPSVFLKDSAFGYDFRKSGGNLIENLS